MPSITGAFHVVLSTPVEMEYGVTLADFGSSEFEFEFEQKRIAVEVSPLKFEQPEDLMGSTPPPVLREFSVLIKREVDQLEDVGTASLAFEELESFERALSEAVSRLMQIIRSSTEQWLLETRLAFRPTVVNFFDSKGDPVGDPSPVSYEFRAPEPSDYIEFQMYGDRLTPVIWQQVVSTMSRSKKPPLHKEILDDAYNYAANGRFDVAVLFSAVAAEIILERMCKQVLKSKAKLSDKQSDMFVNDLKVHSLVKIMCSINSSIDKKKLEFLFKRRNKIAHSGQRRVSFKEVSESLGTARGLLYLLKERQR